jgi:hypothetical protein
MAKKEKVKSPKKGEKIRPSRWIILAIIMLAMWLVGVLLSHRLTALLCVVGSIVCVILFIIGLRADPTSHISLWGVSIGLIGGMFSFGGNFLTMFDYSYCDNGMPFWKISLVLSLAIGILVTVTCFRKIDGFRWKLLSIGLVALFAFFLVWPSLNHMNCLLDFQPPVERHAVIEEADCIQHGQKSPTSYQFRMTLDEERVHLRVPWTVYRKYNEGDTYTFYEYKGAFGEPFYLAKE